MEHFKDPSMDDAFLKKLTETVLHNLDNEQFGVENLSEQVGMSRSHLHRKLKLLKGQSVSQFIREMRLEEAMKLLQQDVATTSEIAYRVGFGSTSYFNTCFHAYYGYPPGEVKKRMLEGKNNQHPHASTSVENVAKQKELTASSGQEVHAQNTPSSQRKVPRRISLAAAVFLLLVGFYYWMHLKDAGQKALAASIKSVAILPLNDFSGEGDNERFLAGIHQALISKLGQVSALRVISRTSTLAYQRAGKSAPEIAKELNVDAIIEASMLEFKKNISIQINLIYPFPEEKQLWSQTFTQSVGDVFTLYNSIAKKIAKQINIKLSPQEAQRLADAKPVDPEAYKTFLIGRFYWEKLTEESLDIAYQYFQKANEIDEEFAKPYVAKAAVWSSRLGMGFVSPAEAIPKIYDQLNKFHEFEEYDAETYALLAGLTFWVEWNWQKGEELYEKSIELNANDAVTLAYYAHSLMLLKQSDQALEQMERAMEIDPLNPLITAMASAFYLYNEKNFTLAITLAKKCLTTEPNNRVALGTLVDSYFLLGDFEQAIEIGKRIFSDINLEGVVNLDDEKASFQHTMEKLGVLLEEISMSQYIEPIKIASVYTYANNPQKALQWLEITVNTHSPNASYIFLSPTFHPLLKDEPKYQALAKKMGLPF